MNVKLFELTQVFRETTVSVDIDGLGFPQEETE
jgi:hypothetical protein